MTAWRMVSSASWSERSMAALLAVLVHALFLVLLVLSVSWKNRDAEPVGVELWSPAALRAAVGQASAPIAPPLVAPQPPQPVLSAPPATEAPPDHSADIALAELKHERAQLLQQQAEAKAQAAKQLEQKQLDQKRLDQKRQQAQQAQQAAAAAHTQAVQKLLAQQMQADLHAQSETALKGVRQQVAAGQQASRQARQLAEYQDRIKSKIRSRIILPEGLTGNPEAVFAVVVLPTGEVVQVRLLHASGQPAYDAAVQRAIIKASPLPMPPDPELAGQFRDLNLHFSPDTNE